MKCLICIYSHFHRKFPKVNWLNQEHKKLRDGDFTEVAGGAEETVHRSGSLEGKRAQTVLVTRCWWIDGCTCRVPRKHQTEQRTPLTGDLQECLFNGLFFFPLHYDSQMNRMLGVIFAGYCLYKMCSCSVFLLDYQSVVWLKNCAVRSLYRPALKLSINWSCSDNLKVTDCFQERKIEKQIL